MHMTIDISPEEQAAYEAQAKAEGLTVEEWLKRLANERAQPEQEAAQSDVASKSLLELFAPIRGLDVDFSRNPSTGRSVDL